MATEDARLLHAIILNPQEEQALSQRLLWFIMEEAGKDYMLGNRLRCHPNELRDLAQATPPRKSPGPDGLPSQMLRNLPITAYADLAHLFEELLCDFSLAESCERKASSRMDSGCGSSHRKTEGC